MLPPGTVIEVQLPEHQAPTQATVLSCSSTMASVRLQEIGSEAVHRVSLKKLPYTIIEQPSERTQQQQPVIDHSRERRGKDARDQRGAAAVMDVQVPRRGAEQQEDGGKPGEPGDDNATELEAFPMSTAALIEAFAATLASDPAAFLQPTSELMALAKAATKALYDYQAAMESDTGTAAATGRKFSGGNAAVLPELYVDGFDAEQIWLQLELAVGPALKRVRKLLKKAGQEPQLLMPETEEAIDELLEEEEVSYDDGTEEEDSRSVEVSASGGEAASHGNAGQPAANFTNLEYDALLPAGAAQHRKRQPAAGINSKEEEAQLAGMKRKRANGVGAAAWATVEDDHFKLDEMEAFVQQAEREAAGVDDEDVDKTASSEDEEGELKALLEQQVAALSGHNKKKAKGTKKKAAFGDGANQDEYGKERENIGAQAMYEDFFGPRSGGRWGPTLVAAGGNWHRQQEQLLGKEDPQDREQSSQGEEEEFEDDLLSDDMLSGEEDDESAERWPRQGFSNGSPGLYSEEEEEVENWGAAADAGLQQDMMTACDQGEDDKELAPSAHERRQQRMQERIRKLEKAAIGEKDWFLQGEVDAGRRPKNSALEIDLDFETTVKPPPQPTEEMTKTLDELIKARIAEGRFDSVARILAPPCETKRTTLELDDKKPQQGLGELYEQEYMHAVTGVADDKDEEVRHSARAQFSALCAKLDALSHLHFTPRPVIEEVTVKVDVPAIMMEEAAPQFVSSASMQAPEEVFAKKAAGAPRADEELSREDRKRRRAQRKRAGKKRWASEKEERAAQSGDITGHKSEVAEQAARKLTKNSRRNKAIGSSKSRSEFSRSVAVMAKIEEHKVGVTAATATHAVAAPRAAAQLKL